ncbi:hypothetical protein VTO73DRAFT_6197 [Trametes versicolor]
MDLKWDSHSARQLGTGPVGLYFVEATPTSLASNSFTLSGCHTSPREHIRKSEQVNLTIPDITGIRELFKHTTTLCARDPPSSFYDVSGIIVFVVMTKYGIFSNISGFAFLAAGELAGHSVLTLHHKWGNILRNAKSTLLCVMAAPELELARSQAQKIPKLSVSRSWTAHGPLKSADHDHKYALLPYAACSIGIPEHRRSRRRPPLA